MNECMYVNDDIYILQNFIVSIVTGIIQTCHKKGTNCLPIHRWFIFLFCLLKISITLQMCVLLRLLRKCSRETWTKPYIASKLQ